MLLHIRDILEGCVVDDIFDDHFPQTRKEYILYNELTAAEVETPTDNEEEGPYCAICRDPFTETNELSVRTKCGHVFGDTCLLEWLKADQSCPMCRREIFAVYSQREFKKILRCELFARLQQIPSPAWLCAFIGNKDGTLPNATLAQKRPWYRRSTCQKVDPSRLGKEVLEWFDEEVIFCSSKDTAMQCGCSSCRKLLIYLAHIDCTFASGKIYFDREEFDIDDKEDQYYYDYEEAVEETEGEYEELWLNSTYGVVEEADVPRLVPDEVLELGRLNLNARGRIRG